MKFYTVKEVADLLRLDETTIRRYLRAGTLKGLQVSKNGKWRISEESLNHFLQGEATTTPQEEETK